MQLLGAGCLKLEVMTASNIPYGIECGACSLHLADTSNTWFIEELFSYEDVKKFYVLRPDHAANIRAFCQYVVNANQQKTSLNFVISNNYGKEVGFISAEPIMNNATNMPVWNVGYAVHPSHRHQGYASSALKGLTDFLLRNFSFQQVMLDIAEDNTASVMVARKCGFTKPDNSIGYYDTEHPEIGMRFRWFKQLAGGRTIYFNQAVHYHRQKQYAKSLEFFKNALNEPYIPGTPFTDAQIYSNIGMALSSLRRYTEAFQALKKAQSLGLNNPSIERELLWLRNNVGIF